MGKRYLIRAGYNPLDKYNVKDALFNNITGWNSGNQLYAYGVYNVLYNGNNELVSTYYKTDFSEEEIKYIDENFDAFVLPLADAFRSDWEQNLRAYTNIIRKLHIPCIVIGACLRAPYNADLNDSFPFDDSVKEFVSAVLEKSEIIGLRGRRTGEYLKKFGFIEDKDFVAIGCPSLYTYGNTFKERKSPNEINKIVFNINPNIPEKINRFIHNTSLLVPEKVLVLQEMDEFRAFYYGKKYNGWTSIEFPYSDIDYLAHDNKIRYFFDPQQWVEYVSHFDISLGTRFHGTVANVLSGIPYVVIPIDSRMQELVEFHQLTHIDMNKCKGNLLEHLDKLDFNLFEKHQDYNLQNYIRFLKRNGLESVFDLNINMSRGCSPLEKERCRCNQIVDTFDASGFKERLRRRCELVVSHVNIKYGKSNLFSFKGRG